MFLLLFSLSAQAGDLPEIKGWSVTESTFVGAPPELVQQQVLDLETWPEWTAWSRERDPECAWTFEEGDDTGVGASMDWLGPELGEGRLVWTEVAEHELMFELYFDGRPQQNLGRFSFEDEEGGTRVTWQTVGPMGPIMRLFFRGKIEEMIAADFAQGLATLKAQREEAYDAWLAAEAAREVEEARRAEEARLAAEAAEETAQEDAEATP